MGESGKCVSLRTIAAFCLMAWRGVAWRGGEGTNREVEDLSSLRPPRAKIPRSSTRAFVDKMNVISFGQHPAILSIVLLDTDKHRDSCRWERDCQGRLELLMRWKWTA